MEDLTGLGKFAEGVAKLADSQLVVQSYDDLLAPGMKETGKFIEDAAKSFRLFTAPIQLLAVAQDRLQAFCEIVRKKVPEERQQEAQPSIALPILMAVRFIEDENPMLQMFAELLARGIDRERINEVHPSFASIISQLSPDEAIILWNLKTNSLEMGLPFNTNTLWAGDFDPSQLSQPHLLRMYWEHLQNVNLVEGPSHYIELDRDYAVLSEDGPSHKPTGQMKLAHRQRIKATSFGELFISACVPDECPSTKSGST